MASDTVDKVVYREYDDYLQLNADAPPGKFNKYTTTRDYCDRITLPTVNFSDDRNINANNAYFDWPIPHRWMV